MMTYTFLHNSRDLKKVKEVRYLGKPDHAEILARLSEAAPALQAELFRRFSKLQEGALPNFLMFDMNVVHTATISKKGMGYKLTTTAIKLVDLPCTRSMLQMAICGEVDLEQAFLDFEDESPSQRLVSAAERGLARLVNLKPDSKNLYTELRWLRFERFIEELDWFTGRSDDHSVYQAGQMKEEFFRAERAALLNLDRERALSILRKHDLVPKEDGHETL